MLYSGQPLGSYHTRCIIAASRSLEHLHFIWNKEFNSYSESACFHSTIFGGKCIFLTKLSVPCGSSGLPIYRAPASIPENCMVASGPLAFSRATDHKHSNFTMVTCFIPTASLAPTVWDSWHSIYLPKQFEHADQLLFIPCAVLYLTEGLCIEKMVHAQTDDK